MSKELEGKEVSRDRSGHGVANWIEHRIEFNREVHEPEVARWLKEQGWLGYDPEGYFVDHIAPYAVDGQKWTPIARSNHSKYWGYKHSASCD